MEYQPKKIIISDDLFEILYRLQQSPQKPTTEEERAQFALLLKYQLIRLTNATYSEGTYSLSSLGWSLINAPIGNYQFWFTSEHLRLMDAMDKTPKIVLDVMDHAHLFGPMRELIRGGLARQLPDYLTKTEHCYALTFLGLMFLRDLRPRWWLWVWRQFNKLPWQWLPAKWHHQLFEYCHPRIGIHFTIDDNNRSEV